MVTMQIDARDIATLRTVAPDLAERGHIGWAFAIESIVGQDVENTHIHAGCPLDCTA